MWGKFLLVGVSLIALVLLVSAPGGAASTHEGKVVEAGKGKLTMTDMAGSNQHTHDVASDAEVTCEGQSCNLDSLQPGDMITVALDQKDGKSVVTAINRTAAGMGAEE